MVREEEVLGRMVGICDQVGCLEEWSCCCVRECSGGCGGGGDGGGRECVINSLTRRSGLQ